MLLPNTLLQRRYLIVRPLGGGGMGTVYEARDQILSAIVAVKEAHTAGNDELTRAFEREAKLLANLRHPLLPRVTNRFMEGHNQYLVMEFISGDDLAQLLNTNGQPFAPAQVLKWADDLLGVLDFLHGRSTPIIHRDIKPANLKCTPEGELMLVDFGLAKGTAGYMTEDRGTSSMYGFTPVYAPLEQIRCAGTDQRSDLYALAATLIHLWKGQSAPSAYVRDEAVASGLQDPLEEFLETPPTLPREIADILRRAMALQRDLRTTSAIEMRQALREASQSAIRGKIESPKIDSEVTVSKVAGEETEQDHLATVQRIGAAIRQSLELDSMLLTAAKEISRALAVSCCAIRVDEPLGPTVTKSYFTSDVNVGGEISESLSAKLDAISAELSKSLKTCVVHGSNTQAQTESSYVAVPLVFQGNFAGLLLVTSNDPKRVWTEKELLFLHTVSDQLTVAANQAHLFDQMLTKGLRDALTGCYNRRAFDLQLERDLKLATRCAWPVSLLMVDIDHLNRINQEHGYKVGDEVLCAVADTIRSELRAVDTAARYGPVDFAVILPQANREAGLMMADRICSRVRNLGLPTVGQMTVSAGVVFFPDDGPSSEALENEALLALNASRRSGGNRVSIPVSFGSVTSM